MTRNAWNIQQNTCLYNKYMVFSFQVFEFHGHILPWQFKIPWTNEPSVNESTKCSPSPGPRKPVKNLILMISCNTWYGLKACRVKDVKKYVQYCIFSYQFYYSILKIINYNCTNCTVHIFHQDLTYLILV